MFKKHFKGVFNFLLGKTYIRVKDKLTGEIPGN